MAEFTNAAWDGPAVEARLDASDFCAVSLIDTNEEGAEKVKARCKLPIRATRGGPYNRNALRNAAGRIFQVTDVPAAERRRAAGRLVRLMREAGITVGRSVLRLAGLRE